ncbi:MAG: SAM-dependent methyltransferase [Myxococcota bacterium]|nr:SAM-dependent methyltransferase [Myxococcota bacterium]
MKALSPPSPFFSANRGVLRDAARLGLVADLACGRGRHAVATAQDGLTTVALDHNPDYLADLGARATLETLPLHPLRWDLETPLGLPFAPGRCGAILVFRFLYRPLAPALSELLAAGGILLYETFTTGQLELGVGPQNPAFLLEPGELPELFPDLEIVSCEEGRHGDAVTARLLARRA